jgi:MSHA biogenesis protein MshJ
VKERLAALAERIDRLEPKERVLLLIAGVLVAVMAWDSLAMRPLRLREQTLSAQAELHAQRLAEISAESAHIIEVAARDPDAELERQIADADAQIAGFEQEIRERAGQLIDPRQMPAILQRVLEQTRGLAFVGLEGLGAEPLLPPAKPAARGKAGAPAAATAAAEGAEVSAFRHGFRVRFEGSYLSTLAYLRALEALPWRFFWDSVEIDVTEYPGVRAAVVVYTLSLDRRWIGV